VMSEPTQPPGADPIADLTGRNTSFETAPTARPRRDDGTVREAGEGAGYVSRAAAAPIQPIRRWRTGRNVQLNLKVTQETFDRFYRLADERRLRFGELLEQALDALEGERH
jgi:hypothetical protein